jgi:hypothetical protein
VLVPETAGVSLEEVDRLFESNAGREDAELRQEVSCPFLILVHSNVIARLQYDAYEFCDKR